MAQPVDTLKSALRGVVLLGGLIAIGAGLSHLGVRPRAYGTDGWHQILFLLSAAGLTAIGVPRQAVCFAAGFGFGALHGGGLAWGAQILGCAGSFYWARLAARGATQRFLAAREQQGKLAAQFARADRFLARNPFGAALTLRLLPVGNNLVLNLVAGISAIPAGAFLSASALGYIPQTMVFALAGSGVQVEKSTQLWMSAGFFVTSMALGFWLLKNLRETE